MARRRVVVAFLFGVGALGCYALTFAPKRPDGGAGLLTVGTDTPDFSARDASGARFAFSRVRGKPAVVFFYPKDGTPGCTMVAPTRS